MNVQVRSPSVRSRTTADIKSHAVCAIDENIDEWRRLRRPLAAAQCKLRERKEGNVQSGNRSHAPDADVRLLQHRCQRALDALGAAVAARRALSSAERPH